MRFWDSSAIVPLLVEEPLTKRAAALLAEDSDVIAWWGARIECSSGLRRREREHSGDAGGVRAALGRLEALADRWSEVLPSNAVRVGAERSLAVHPLRVGDAFQLAAALTWRGDSLERAAVVCFDERLGDAAEREGFRVLGVS